MDDAVPMLKRKGAEAREPWLDGVPVAKIRRLDAEAPPVAPGAGVLPTPQPFGVGEVHATGDVAAGVAPVAREQPMLKRKGAEAPGPWLDGVPLPATKIRRLDAAEVAPVEPGAGVPSPPQPFGVGELRMSGDSPPPAAAVGVVPVADDERAIVVYQPADAARNLLLGPLRPEVLLRVSPDWIHGLRSTMLQEASNHRALFEELAGRDENLNLAMVPWAPARAASASTGSATAGEMMEAEDGDGASMEVEQDGGGQPAPLGEAFHHQQQQQQWPPQHCVPPQQLQLPAASYQPSPVTWSW